MPSEHPVGPTVVGPAGPPVGLIWAQAHGRVVGADGAMPWHLPEDLARFRALTTGCPVVMGRRTWESLPERFRPLPGRVNVVLSRRPGRQAPGATVVGDLAAALAVAGGSGQVARVWVIGGAQLWTAALHDPDLQARTDLIERTEIDLDVPGDVLAPDPGPAWQVVRSEPEQGWLTSRTGLRYRYRTLHRTG